MVSLLALMVGLAAAPQQRDMPGSTSVAQLTGRIRDTVSGQPVRLAIVRLSGMATSALSDDDGQFRLAGVPGVWHLEVRRIGYRPASLTLTVAGDTTGVDVYLHPVPIGLAGITVTPVVDPALAIMARVISHKRDVLAGIHDYRYDAYAKFVVRDLSKPPDSAAAILLVTESRTQAYWEQPGHYQETILARRQSGNLDPDQNLVSVGEIVNFNRDRIDLRKYALVSPIADDALAHYDYRMLDTLEQGGRRIFTIAIVPRTEASPLFVGVITVADSTYDVLAVDVGVNSATRFNFVSNLRYRQRLADMGGGRWMPAEIRLTGDIHLALPIPGIPSRLTFEHVAELDSFRFDQGHRPAGVGEYRVVVSDGADRPDSATWAAPAAIPLSEAERAAWVRIDSLAHRPKSVGTIAAEGVGTAVILATDPEFFHFNRVDGAFLGAGRAWRSLPGWVFTTRAGYGFGSERWQYGLGVESRVSEAQRLWVGVTVHDETVRRPTFVSGGYNPTFRALVSRIDPLDYYRERGVQVLASSRLLPFTRLDLVYDDARQSSLAVVTDYALSSRARALRPNLPIGEGHLRSVTATVSYDSRPLLKSKGIDYRLRALTGTRVTASAEVAAPDLIPNDFSYRRYVVQVDRVQRMLNLGVTTVRLTGGMATGLVPPQRYFTVDFGMEFLTFQGNGFNTLNGDNFSGTRAAMITLRHDFDRLLFAKSGVPILRDLPFTLSVHGGVFWTEFSGHAAYPGDTLLRVAPRPYTEAGFGVGNLTPFLSPINLALHLTWQLSSYSTTRFRFGLGLTRP